MEFLQQIAGPLAGLILSFVVTAIAWGIRKTSLKEEFKQVLVAFTQRIVDKAQERLSLALSPDSEGGVKVTSAEVSAIRQAVWDALKTELKGPLAKVLASWGEEQVKGYVGQLLTKWGIVASDGLLAKLRG